jgi:callose synthase
MHKSDLCPCGQSLLIYSLNVHHLLHRVRFHYGHPDVFDRLFHITRGGISKASKTINLSEDIYAGTDQYFHKLLSVKGDYS